MKKLLALAIVLASFASCKKENVQQQCNCGVIQSDDAADYSVVIKNKCSGNNKKFNLSPADWMSAYVGSEFCITNVSSW